MTCNICTTYSLHVLHGCSCTYGYFENVGLYFSQAVHRPLAKLDKYYLSLPSICFFRHLLAHLADRMDLDGEGLR